MKRIFLIGLGLLVVFLLFGNEGSKGKDQIEENIDKLIAGIELVPDAGQEKTNEFIRILVESVLLTAPKANIPQNIQSEIKECLEEYESADHALLQKRAVEALWEAARSYDPEFDLLIPEDATIKSLKEDTRLEFFKAISFHNQGNDEEVFEILLRTVLRIVTPIER